LLRASPEGGQPPAVKDSEDPEIPLPSGHVGATAAQVATIGIFVLLLGACLYFCRPILLPVLAALVVGTTLAPIVKALARHRIPPWLTAIGLGIVLISLAGVAVTLLAAPVSEWIGKAPEIGANIKQKLYVLDRPLAALRELEAVLLPPNENAVAIAPSQWGIVTPVIAFVTPAAVQFMLFFVTLIFFLATQMDFRRYMASFFPTRGAKLRFMRIANDIEDYLATYIATVTAINFALGVLVALGAWLFGLPNPFIFGILAMLLNYIPYIGPACMAVVLFSVGLVAFPSLSYALIPAAAFVGLATLEGQVVTPTVLGRRIELNPLVVLLALAFWAWLWGPIGAFLAVPFTIVGMVTLNHLFPQDEAKLPG
jgi:predicted PurR-regulated permease PerM